MKPYKAFISLLLAFAFTFFFSCRTNIILITIKTTQKPDEAAVTWLNEQLSAFADGLEIQFKYPYDGDDADIIIELTSLYSTDGYDIPPDKILVSKIWHIPFDDSLNGNLNTSLEDCLNGNLNLTSIDLLNSPNTAMRVNGYSADSFEYPLVHISFVNLITKNQKKSTLKKTEELAGLLRFIPKPLVEEKPVITWISFAGDTMLGRNAGNILLNEGAKILMGGAFEILYNSDIAVINLEGPLSSRGRPAQKTYTFRFEPPNLLAKSLKDAGIDAVLFANNHSFDYGEDAFLDTLDYLNSAQIAILGSGKNIQEILTPFVYEKEGSSLNLWGIASFPSESTGWNGLQHTATEERGGFLHSRREGGKKLSEVLSEIENDSLKAIYFHGGTEWSSKPDQNTRELYASLIEAGADLIIGSHPHIVQGFEYFGEKLIFWSLGNFIFSGMENTNGGDEGLLIRLGYNQKKLVYLEPFALTLTGPKTDLALNQEQKLKLFYQKSKILRDASY